MSLYAHEQKVFAHQTSGRAESLHQWPNWSQWEVFWLFGGVDQRDL